MNLKLADIWIAAGILMGFQIASFSWRVMREATVGDKQQPTWLPPADWVNLVSMLTLVIGVFIMPIVHSVDLNLVKHVFGLALILFAGYPFALAGHYDMYNHKTARGFEYFTLQEKLAIVVIVAVVIVYVVLWVR